MSDTHAAPTGIRAWWNALSFRTRERVLLGTLVAVAVAARDALLLSFAAGLFGLLEFRDVMPPASSAAQAS